MARFISKLSLRGRSGRGNLPVKNAREIASPACRPGSFRFVALAMTTVFLCFSGMAMALPLTGVSLRLVPLRAEDADLAPRIVEVVKDKGVTRVKWFSLTREEVFGLDYPTFKIKADRGVLDVGALSDKKQFLHPYLWAEGYMNLSDSLPLWIAPEYLDMSGKKARAFDVGFLDVNPDLLKGAPDKLYEQLLFFQNLYRYYFTDRELNKSAKVTREDQKELKSFVKDFTEVSLLAKTKAKLVINKQVKDFDAKIIGNEYFQMIVLDDKQNPLVLAFRLYPEKAPRVFKNNFSFLKKHFEYQITQVNY